MVVDVATRTGDDRVALVLRSAVRGSARGLKPMTGEDTSEGGGSLSRSTRRITTIIISIVIIIYDDDDDDDDDDNDNDDDDDDEDDDDDDEDDDDDDDENDNDIGQWRCRLVLKLSLPATPRQ